MITRDSLKRFRPGRLLALLVLASCVGAGSALAQPEVYGGGYANVSVEVFDNALSPYGEWMAVGRFGRAWRPYRTIVGLDFRPYLSGGHWVYTDYGWTFESDYEWGWAPFHYGRWMMDDYYGWVWIPDSVWGPAWVDWRFGGGYVGWVPLAPVGFSIGVGFGPAWCFVPVTHFVVRDMYHYALPVDRFHWAYSVTSPIRQPVHYAGVQWNAGPPAGQVSQVIGHPVQPVRIAPPPPGQIQAVRLGAPTGVPNNVSINPGGVRASPPPLGSAPRGAAPVPSGAPAFGGRPPPGAAQGPSAFGVQSSPAPSPGSAHASPGAPTGSPVLGNHRPSAEEPKAMPPHPSETPSGMKAPAAPSPGEAHWGHGPVGGAPRWGGSNEGWNQSQPLRAAPPASAPGYPASGGVAPRAAPPPAPPTGNPGSGRVAPSMPPGNQGFRPPASHPNQMIQMAPQYRAPPVRSYAAQQAPSAMRTPPPVAYRSAPAPQSFAGSHSAPAPQSSGVHVGGAWGRAR